MIEVKKSDKVSLIFEPNIALSNPIITYEIKDLGGKVIINGNGNFEDGEIKTEIIDFSDMDEGYYEVQIYCSEGLETKTIYEFLKVEE